MFMSTVNFVLYSHLYLFYLSNGVDFLNNNERSILLNIHNDYRSGIANGEYNTLTYNFQPSASNMNKLHWDIALESLAMDYAKHCIKAHNPIRHTDILNYKDIASFQYLNDNRMYVGENWYASPLKIDGITISKTQPLLAGIKWFFDELKVYNYSKTYQSIAGHYTQIVWASTRFVGCGYSSCNFGTLLVCNYWPPGNVPGQYPYLSTGTSDCTLCDPDRTSCDTNLCGGCMSSSYTNNGDLTADLCEELGDFPIICGNVISDGTSQGLSVEICVDLETQIVDIILIGPSDVWFGVGFDAVNMDNAYSIVIHGNSTQTKASEYILTQWSAGNPVTFDGENGIKIINSKTENGIKTVHVQRNRLSKENGVYSFPSYPSSIAVIFGKGIGLTYQGPMGGHSTASQMPLSLAIVDTSLVISNL